MPRVKSSNIDQYLSGFPENTAWMLKQIREIIRKAAPQAEETISYGIPAFKLNNRILVYFAGFKTHVSIYPAPRGEESFKNQLASFKGGKGTVQFPLDKPLPAGLIRRIVLFHVRRLAEKSLIKSSLKKR